MPAIFFQRVGGFRYRGMFRGTDRKESRLVERRKTLDREIAGLGSAAGENHLARMRIDQLGHLLARPVDGGARRAAIAMHTRRVAMLFRQIRKPRFQRRSEEGRVGKEGRSR